MSAPFPAKEASHARYKAVAFGVALSFITYLDRVVGDQLCGFGYLGGIAPTAIQMGYVFSAFGLTYALLEIPSGWLCDRIGPRKVLMRIVLWWSFFTAATGWAWNLPSLLATRFGAGEAGCFPGLAKSSPYLAAGVRAPHGRGVQSDCRTLAAVTPFLLVTLYSYVSWRAAFSIFGAIGGFKACLLLVVSRRSRWTPGGEFSRAALLAHNLCRNARSTWADTLAPISRLAKRLGAVCAMVLSLLRFLFLHHLAADLPSEGAWTESPARSSAGRHAHAQPAWVACSGGWLATRLARSNADPARTRRMLGYCAYGGASALLLAFTSIHDTFWAIFVMSLSAFAAEFSGPISWTTVMDLGGRHTGSLSAAMNMMGHFGGAALRRQPSAIFWKRPGIIGTPRSTARPRSIQRECFAGLSSIP